MHDFKEWLSDNLRYFLVGVVVILIIGGSILGLRIYSSAVNGNDKVAVIQKNTESQDTEKDTQKETEKATKKETEKQTEKQTEKPTEKQTEKQTETQSESSAAGDDGQNASDGANGSANSQAEIIQPETAQTEAPQPETVQTEPPEPVYLTLNGACYMRSYPDYGDNIIGQYDAGTTVQFLADVGGWYEVSVNGQVGYMGARFFN